MKLVKNILLIFFVITSLTQAQEIIDLYSGEIPNSKKSNIKEEFKNGMFSKVTIPKLEIFLAEKDKNNGLAVIICPGGGYGVVVYEMEGIKTAKEFTKNGVNAFLLKYRLPNDSIMIDKKNGTLQDALQAIKLVRENSEKWGIEKSKIGIMGFSAGGHLASTAATHFDMQIIENNSNINLRPDFQILIYPVISMQEGLTHLGSRENLLGKNPTKELIDFYSNELQVNENIPPAYVTHTGDDKVVDVENSLEYYKALKTNNVPTEMHIYPKGNHGFVLSQPVEEWMEPILKWLKKLN
ncbi:MAG: alpha/beta hydrolase [Ignavibacteriae bacterium]|nr:alpha/beta hydrolase [Ignavibacteriota bacterium]